MGRRSWVGLNPVTPQNEAGLSIEPLVCSPIVKGTMPAATAAAEPLELPPGVWSRFRGFRVGPGDLYAKAVVTVFPRRMAPRLRISRIMAASRVPSRPLYSGEPYSV